MNAEWWKILPSAVGTVIGLLIASFFAIVWFEGRSTGSDVEDLKRRADTLEEQLEQVVRVPMQINRQQIIANQNSIPVDFPKDYGDVEIVTGWHVVTRGPTGIVDMKVKVIDGELRLHAEISDQFQTADVSVFAVHRKRN